MVIFRPTPFASGIHRVISSSSESTPSRARSTSAVAVNCLATEPLSEMVPTVQGVAVSRLAMPYARRNSGTPPVSTPTAQPGVEVRLHATKTESTRRISTESAACAWPFLSVFAS